MKIEGQSDKLSLLHWPHIHLPVDSVTLDESWSPDRKVSKTERSIKYEYYETLKCWPPIHLSTLYMYQYVKASLCRV